MKPVKLFTSVFAALLLFATPVFATVDAQTEATKDYEAELKNSAGVILESLLSLAHNKAFTLNGEIKTVSKSSILDMTDTKEETSKVTGMYQLPDKMYLKSVSESSISEVLVNEKGYYVRIGEDGEWNLIRDMSDIDFDNIEDIDTIDNIDFSALLLTQTRDMQKLIDSYKIVNVFEDNGVKYIDISIESIKEKLDEIIAGLKDTIVAEMPLEEEDGLEVLQEMFNSMEISTSGYYRINTNSKKVEGMGYDMKMSMELELMGLPLSVVSDSNSFIKIEGTDKELVFPSVE